MGDHPSYSISVDLSLGEVLRAVRSLSELDHKTRFLLASAALSRSDSIDTTKVLERCISQVIDDHCLPSDYFNQTTKA